jgi:DNA-binding GntR family transcriptional regulator
MQMYGVARNTARHAVGYLRDQGYVFTKPQRAAFVAERAPEEPGESTQAPTQDA